MQPLPSPALEAVELCKVWRADGGRRVTALDHVNIQLFRGGTLALTGVSGCGKSTLARCLAMLSRPDSGSVVLHDVNGGGGAASRVALESLPADLLRSRRKKIQLIFQDAGAALDPHFTIAQSITEAIEASWDLDVSGRRHSAQVEGAVDAWLTRAGLSRSHGDALPHELSGGERQRVCIARALAAHPDVLLLDEPTASLDVSVRAGIVQWIRTLQKERGLTCLWITHDLELIPWVADRVAVMDGGAIVETCGAAEFTKGEVVSEAAVRLLDSRLS